MSGGPGAEFSRRPLTTDPLVLPTLCALCTHPAAFKYSSGTQHTADYTQREHNPAPSSAESVW